MKGSSFGYLLRTGVKSVFRNRLMSFAAIGVLVACMILIGSAGLLSLNMNKIVEYAEKQNEFVVIAADDVDDQGLANLDMDLHTIEGVLEVVFYSREEAFDDYKTKLGDETLFDEMSADFLPDAYKVRIDDLSRLRDCVAKATSFEGVQRVNAPTDMADMIVQVKQAVYIGGVGLVAILLVVALIIIANTIKITVFNRRKEINIMKFVGATDAFIRLPFVVEGLMLGLIAAISAFFVVWGGYEYLITWMQGNQSALFVMFEGQVIPFQTIAVPMFCAFSGAGVFIGVGGSMIFVRRYLRV